jgi:hypothetical protein
MAASVHNIQWLRAQNAGKRRDSLTVLLLLASAALLQESGNSSQGSHEDSHRGDRRSTITVRDSQAFTSSLIVGHGSSDQRGRGVPSSHGSEMNIHSSDAIVGGGSSGLGHIQSHIHRVIREGGDINLEAIQFITEAFAAISSLVLVAIALDNLFDEAADIIISQTSEDSA